MAKRSPILGYNHNVRYRGLVFHVQTEDSGVLSPHLFTHLFHGGVIVSTRKLVYDAGADEDAIKSLMQAQHKAVMKDLMRGTFDDKIDQYLGGTEGLEPRTSIAERPSAPEVVTPPPGPEHRATSALDIELAAAGPGATPAAPRTITASRGSAPSKFRPPPPSIELDPPTISEPPGAIAAAIEAAPTAQVPRRASTPPPVPVRTGPPLPQSRPTSVESSPEISISLSEDDVVITRGRQAHDTLVEATPVDGDVTEAVPVPDEPRSNRPSRPPSHGAATLPPVARSSTRSPARAAMSTPPVVSRPANTPDGRRDNDAVEVYAAPMASADPPPGERGERPGQYSVQRGARSSIPPDMPLRDPPGRPAVPSGLGRPRQPSGSVRAQTPAAGTPPATPPARGTPQPRVTAPIAARNPSGGVVMTRPAVIVGAPQKPAGGPPRVRKAREDEGRGFGQGLISEKSLDEVILAYLSEDAEEK